MENQFFQEQKFENASLESGNQELKKPKKTRAEILYEKKLKVEKENEKILSAIKEMEKKSKLKAEKTLIEMIKKSVGKNWFEVFKTINKNSDIEIFIDGKNISELKSGRI